MSPATAIRSTPQQPTVLPATEARPTVDKMLDSLRGAGLTTKQAGDLLALFTNLSLLVAIHEEKGTRPMTYVDDVGLSEVWETTDTPYIAAVTMATSDHRHVALEIIMADLAVSTPGSSHDILERGLLRDGDTFVHDFAGRCIVAVKRG